MNEAVPIAFRQFGCIWFISVPEWVSVVIKSGFEGCFTASYMVHDFALVSFLFPRSSGVGSINCSLWELLYCYIVCWLILFNVFYFQVEEKPTAFHFEVEKKLTAFSCHLCSAKYVHQQSLTKHLREKHQVQRIIFIFSYSQHFTYAQSTSAARGSRGIRGTSPPFFFKCTISQKLLKKD